ncbi:peptidoglycan-binding domain-containing protein [Paracraurococcus lichenis]|uniref:Peptidoglycan-binding domain-containing protein n=1 Tax=Paracraurococcus lichenis TaxID=3064888 RepID=A0ABT9DZ44_9PROT|nr:peptidoglycan-binding domain-containing protein [Paracraurococcus sp. LOR1-02]MDO9709187.1 peptidoglycan-binding domain-containing protein [Paracraurococcus sp. LOR1-02]
MSVSVPPAEPPPRIAEKVGNGCLNNPQDVLWAKLALACLGRYPASAMAHGYIDRALDTAIRNYQRDRGLRCNGMIRPGGETERNLRTDLLHVAEVVAP